MLRLTLSATLRGEGPIFWLFYNLCLFCFQNSLCLRVVHLVLIDPWGFVGQEEGNSTYPSGIRGWVVKKLASFRALTTMRMIGPFGLNAMRKVRQDFGQVYFQTSASTNVSLF